MARHTGTDATAAQRWSLPIHLMDAIFAADVVSKASINVKSAQESKAAVDILTDLRRAISKVRPLLVWCGGGHSHSVLWGRRATTSARCSPVHTLSFLIVSSTTNT